MSSSPVIQLIQLVAQFLWPLLSIIMVFAAVLLFRSDRRAHTLCLLIGLVLHLLIVLYNLIFFGPLSQWLAPPENQDPDRFEELFAIQSGVGLVAEGLICYGLLMVAIIQFRKSRLPEFESEAAANPKSDTIF